MMITSTIRAKEPIQAKRPAEFPAEAQSPLKDNLVKVNNSTAYFRSASSLSCTNEKRWTQPEEARCPLKNFVIGKLRNFLRRQNEEKPSERQKTEETGARKRTESLCRTAGLPHETRLDKQSAFPACPPKVSTDEPGYTSANQPGDIQKLYNISDADFNSLFSDSPDISALISLSRSMAAGNENCLDLLQNIALRQDGPGYMAERILFDLFSNNAPGNEELVENIQQATNQLYQLSARSKDPGKFHQPTRLLYIAGSAQEDPEKRKALTQIFTGSQRPQSAHEQISEQDLWSASRMLTSDELYASTRYVETEKENFSVNYPVPLIDPNGKNILSELLIEKIAAAGGDSFKKVECFPINTGNHWLLVALHKGNAFHPGNGAVIFNSTGKLNPEVRNTIRETLSLAGIKPEFVTTIDRPLQSKVPNGCGVFVREAISVLARDYPVDPATALRQFAEDFSYLHEPERFNIARRRQIYEYSLPRAGR